MKKLKNGIKWIKKHVTSLILFIILLVILLFVILVISVLIPTTTTSAYGDRLNGISDVAISSSELKTKAKEIEDNSIVDKSTIRISGKIIEIKITLNTTGTIDTGKTLAATIVTGFAKDEIAFYDFQVFITSAGADESTVIGYKTPSADNLSWSNN